MADVINFPGTVEWSGENPGISLKADAGRTVRRARELLPRRALAARTRARAGADAIAAGREARARTICLHDNEKLARYLVSDFVSHFGAWKGLPGLKSLTYRPLDSVAASGDPASTYTRP